MHGTVTFRTIGCRLNQAETAALEQAFRAAGWEVVTAAPAARVAVVNTCTVTARADADLRKLVRRLRRRNPAIRIALVGCRAQVAAAQLAAWPQVDWVVGNAAKDRLPEIVGAGEPATCVPEFDRAPFRGSAAAVDPHHTRANLKIQDGCNRRCAYCIVPAARGPSRSRAWDDCLAEAAALVAAGHREIVLTGVDIGDYGADGRDLAALAAAILAAVPALERLRFSSIELHGVSPALLDLMAGEPRVCRHLHVPLQSGSDRIRRLMGRPRSRDDYVAALRAAVERIPDIALGADVLVGYPTETDVDFAATRDLLASLPMSYLHVFTYSERPGTRSIAHGPPVAPPVAAARSGELRDLGDRLGRAYRQTWVGRTVPVLFEQRRDDQWCGMTDTFLRVTVTAAAMLRNQVLPVRLAEVTAAGLSGHLV